MHISRTIAVALSALIVAVTAAPSQGRASVYSQCSVPGAFALTFDDGPYQYSWYLASYLKEKGIPATFFVNGKNWVDVEHDSVETSDGVKTYKQVLKHAYDSGHQIASHTYEHKDLKGLSASEVRYQMNKVADIIEEAIGQRPAFMRPPEGVYDNTALQVLAELGYKVVLWDIDARDWATSNVTESMGYYKSVLDNADPKKTGHIALEHETYNHTVYKLVPQAIDYVQSKGYRFVTVAECLGFDNAYQ